MLLLHMLRLLSITLKKGGGVNINKNLIYYSVKDVWEIKIETPGKNVLKHSDWKEQNKTQRSKKGNK